MRRDEQELGGLGRGGCLGGRKMRHRRCLRWVVIGACRRKKLLAASRQELFEALSPYKIQLCHTQTKRYFGASKSWITDRARPSLAWLDHLEASSTISSNLTLKTTPALKMVSEASPISFSSWTGLVDSAPKPVSILSTRPPIHSLFLLTLSSQANITTHKSASTGGKERAQASSSSLFHPV